MVFFINGLGDHILSLPTLRGLAEVFEGRLTLITAAGNQEFLFDPINVRRRLTIPVWRGNGVWEFDWRRLFESIGECDLFISLAPWFSASINLLLLRMGPVESMGLCGPYQVQVKSGSKHASRKAFDVVRLLAPELQFESFTYSPSYPEACRLAARRIYSKIPRGARVLIVHAETAPAKMWHREKFVSALDLFLDRHPEFIVLTVGLVDQCLDTGTYAERVIPAYGLPFDLSCALVSAAALFLGVDSCMLHWADFARVPAVGLFGPGSADEFGFIVGPHIAIEVADGIQTLCVRQVVSALEFLLNDTNQSTRWIV